MPQFEWRGRWKTKYVKYDHGGNITLPPKNPDCVSICQQDVIYTNMFVTEVGNIIFCCFPIRENKSIGKNSVLWYSIPAIFPPYLWGKERYLLLRHPNVTCGTHGDVQEGNKPKKVDKIPRSAMALHGWAVQHLLLLANTLGNIVGIPSIAVIKHSLLDVWDVEEFRLKVGFEYWHLAHGGKGCRAVWLKVAVVLLFSLEFRRG